MIGLGPIIGLNRGEAFFAATPLPHFGRNAITASLAVGHFAMMSVAKRRSELKMTTTLKILFAGAAVLSALAATAPASAMTVITAFTTGPFDRNALGTIPATNLTNGNTYDFTFTLIAPLGSSTSVQLSAQKLKGSSSTPEIMTYSLYTGTPGSGTFVAQSALMEYSPTISFTPAAGDYYVEVDVISANGETAGGTLTSVVPEPAAWAMMLVGFGGLGLALRRRAAKTASIAA